jgi:hypothetical protein
MRRELTSAHTDLFRHCASPTGGAHHEAKQEHTMTDPHDTAKRLLVRYGLYGAGQIAMSYAIRLYGDSDKGDAAEEGRKFWAQVMIEITKEQIRTERKKK